MQQSPPAFRFATASASDASAPDASAPEAAVRWLLKRHCLLAPARLAWYYLALCLISLGVGAFWGWRGAAQAMPLALLALLAVGSAFMLYARHAGDAEKITLQDGQLVIELASAGQTQRTQFSRESVRVEPRTGNGSLIEVSGQGRSVRVGRHVPPELRPVLAREIRQALRTC